MNLTIATSQFPISANVVENKTHIVAQIQQAKSKGCDLIHFPECSLSGYAGVDFPSFAGFDWNVLKDCLQEVLTEAKAQGIWVLLGSSHLSEEQSKLFNSVYIINDQGEISDRYDKLFCAGDDRKRIGDLAHYTSGDHFTVFDVKGVKCASLICHDYRYPELYRELKRKGVEMVFHSYHAGNMDSIRQQFMESQVGNKYAGLNHGKTYPEITMPATMIAYAASNHLWISCSNTSARESCWASFVVRPDGVIIDQLERNKAGLLINNISDTTAYYDSTELWRERAMNGIYFSGGEVEKVLCKKCSKPVYTKYCGHCGKRAAKRSFSIKGMFGGK